MIEGCTVFKSLALVLIYCKIVLLDKYGHIGPRGPGLKRWPIVCVCRLDIKSWRWVADFCINLMGSVFNVLFNRECL